MSRVGTLTVVLGVAITVTGCVAGPWDIAQISADQSLHQAIEAPRIVRSHYLRGPQVEGQSCSTAIFGLIPVTRRANEKKAVRAALDSQPGGWTTLVDAKVTFVQYPYVLARTLCWKAAGTASRKATGQAQRR